MKMGELYIGVMSGTSLDAVDIALCEIDDNSCKLLQSYAYEFNAELKVQILEAINTTTTLYQVGKIDHELGLLFADAVNAFLQSENLERKDIRAIGLHGQTLWHESEHFSMQLGDANIVAARTGIDVVSDFRRKDMAYGGQGAPFAPAFHKFLFGDFDATAVLNIGGIANITLLQEPLLGFDTGTGNVLLDLWVQKHKNLSYDENGSWAKSGRMHQPLLESFLSDPYFKKKAPKSTGRELFNEAWLMAHLRDFSNVPFQDIQATLLEFTVQSIVLELKKYPLQLLLVCGGGSKNSFLMQRLQEELRHLRVTTTDAQGVSSDYLEAMAFAWFAKKRVHKEAVDLKDVTGASQNSVLGAIYAKN